MPVLPSDGEAWADWPCSLIRLDADGAVVAVNDRFLRHSGYERADLIGRRQWLELLAAGSQLLFDTQLVPVLTLTGAVDEVMIDIVGVDGRRIPVLMNAELIRDDGGQPAGTRIVLMTVLERRDYENNLRLARADAEQAYAGAAHARARLELLAAANVALAASADVDVALRMLAQTLVRDVADWCIVYALDEAHEAPQSWAAAHADSGKQAATEHFAALLPIHATSASTLRRVLEENTPVLLAEVGPDHLSSASDHPPMVDLSAELGLASAMVIPSFARGQRVMAFVLARGPGRAPFTDDDLADLTDLGARTGIAIDNLRLRAREHSNSVALQKALLTPPPVIEQFTIETRYLPATDGAEVGGDWYDAFMQPGGGVAIVVGDVVGHDIHAAARMGQLRGIIRTIANAVSGTPADTLTRADRTSASLQVSTIASAIVAQVELHPSDSTGGRILLWSNAGHPPPVLITAAGEVHLLERRADPLLGVHLGTERHDHSIDLHPGDTVLLYTDGLIERPDEGLDDGLAWLVAAAAGGQLRTTGELCDAIVARHRGRRDDVAMLALRVNG